MGYDFRWKKSGPTPPDRDRASVFSFAREVPFGKSILKYSLRVVCCHSWRREGKMALCRQSLATNALHVREQEEGGCEWPRICRVWGVVPAGVPGIAVVQECLPVTPSARGVLRSHVCNGTADRQTRAVSSCRKPGGGLRTTAREEPRSSVPQPVRAHAVRRRPRDVRSGSFSTRACSDEAAAPGPSGVLQPATSSRGRDSAKSCAPARRRP